MSGNYQIAGIPIRIESVYPKIHEVCSGYATANEPELIIHVEQADIDRTKEKVAKSIERIRTEEGHQITDDYVELFTAYRMIAEQTPRWRTFMFHASIIAADGAAYAFTAQSGTGKSTHSALWRQYLGDKAVMVNDDKPLIRIEEDGRAIAYGTPWNGKHKLGNNIAVPLRAICLLERSKENRIREISKAEAYPFILQQISRPRDAGRLKTTLDLIDQMQVKYYRMGCNKSIDAARMAYEAMNGQA